MRRLNAYDTEIKPGVTTLVTDKSKEDLPNDVDREKQINLPPGSATPNTPRKEDQKEDSGKADGKGRNLKSPAYNGPESGSNVPSRTLPTPGEEYGNPSKDDYNFIRRRTMEAGYKPRMPWKVQHRQRVWKRLDDKKYYQKNKSDITRKVERWYKVVRRDRRFQDKREDRRENPNKYERKKVADACSVAERALSRMGYTPQGIGVHHHHQHGAPKTHRHRQYQHDRAKSRRQHHLWYQRNKNKPAFKHRQQLHRQHPTQFRLRTGAFVPGTDVLFVLGPSMATYVVNSVDDQGVVFSQLQGESAPTPTFDPTVPHHVPGVYDLSVRAFLHAAVFLSPADTDEMFQVLDDYGGDDPYGDLTADELEEVASIYGFDPDALGIVRETAPPEVLNAAANAILEAAMSRWYGRAAGDIILYDQRPPGDWEKPDTSKRTYRSESPGQYTQTPPDATHDPTPTDPATEPNESYYGGGSGKVIPDSMRTAATIGDILSGTAQDVRKRSKSVSVSLKRADPKNGIWTFGVTGSKGTNYQVRIKGLRQGNTKDLQKLDVEVSCTCPFYRWQGPEHWGVAEDFMYGRPQGTASFPKIKDPTRKHLACKHALACLEVAMAYRVASSHSTAPEPSRVAARYGVPVDEEP